MELFDMTASNGMRIIAVAACLGLVAARAGAQGFAVKTNVLSDAIMNVSLGLEAGLAPRWTLEAVAEVNAWTLSRGRRWKHWAVQPEARWWFCDRFAGHFLGLHVHGGQYNAGGFDGWYHFLGTDAGKLAGARYQGWFAGAGLAYGYAFVLGRHWNLEAEAGLVLHPLRRVSLRRVRGKAAGGEGPQLRGADPHGRGPGVFILKKS